MPGTETTQRLYVGEARSQCCAKGPSVSVTRDDSGATVIEGYASVFYDGTPDTEFELMPGLVERIDRGAFDRAAKEDDVMALFNHSPDQIIGATRNKSLKLSVTPQGLKFRISPKADTSTVRDVVANVEAGNVAGSSFGFDVRAEKWERDDDGIEIRTIMDVRLYDVGPVTFPAYKGTSVDIRAVMAISEERAARLRRFAAAQADQAQ